MTLFVDFSVLFPCRQESSSTLLRADKEEVALKVPVCDNLFLRNSYARF